MYLKAKGVLRLLICTLALGFVCGQPRIDQVEPPNWWSGLHYNRLQILLTGSDLEGLEIASPENSGVEISVRSITPGGNYAFVALEISEKAAPGEYRFSVSTPGGTAEFRFPLQQLPSHRDNFQGFGPEDVIYLIMPDRFADGDPNNNNPVEATHVVDRSRTRGHHGGDLQGIIDRIPYLKEIGMTALWTTPIYKNVVQGSYHGYWTLDYYAVEPHLGDIDTYRRLVQTAHQAGLKVIQDQVHNHVGPDHHWVQYPPTPTWLNGSQSEHLANNFNIGVLADPHAAQAQHQLPLQGWFADQLPDLNQNDPEVSRYLIQNTLWWIAASGIDGIRLDTYPYVPRRFWAELQEVVSRDFPHLTMVGEVWHEDADVVSFFQGGQVGFDGIDTGVYSVMDFPLFAAMRRAFSPKGSLRELVEALRGDRLYPDPEALTIFYGNHDSERLATVTGGDLRLIKLANAFLLSCRGIPQLYYGDEIGMFGGGDPDNRRDFPGGFPGDPRSAFEPGQRSEQERKILEHWKKWAGFRRNSPALQKGRLIHLHSDDQVLVFLRSLEAELKLVVLSRGWEARKIEIPIRPELEGTKRLRSMLDGNVVTVEDQVLQLTIQPWSAQLWDVER